jgi:two-component system OmpR family sensor kinase
MSLNVRNRFLTLRARLLAVQFVLLAMVSVCVGFVNEVALYRDLRGQLDEQLRGAAMRASVIYGGTIPVPWHPREEEPGPDILLDAPGLPAGFLASVVKNGAVTEAGVLSRYIEGLGVSPAAHVRVAVSAAAAAELAAVAGDRDPVTRNLDRLGRYRVVSTTSVRTGDTLVVGLSASAIDATLAHSVWVSAGVIVAALAVTTLLGWFLIRRALRPLNRVAAAADEVANLPLHTGEVTLLLGSGAFEFNRHSEVGRVGLALNRMLDNIAAALATRQASENRMRQFSADVSHELRTPLAIVRGYAELVQRRRDEVPADVAHGLNRLEYQAGRMSELVDDLLLLARLDSGRPLKREQVDLTRLCAEAVSDARAAGPDHHWSVAVPSGPLDMIGDGERLYLSIANLLANARVHTPPGTSVAVSLTAEADTSVVQVLDDGPGIPAELQADVFERFTRADGSRSHSGGSTGLGLAIVEAVVRAHGGSIDVSSASGRTEFTVRLPRDT